MKIQANNTKNDSTNLKIFQLLYRHQLMNKKYIHYNFSILLIYKLLYYYYNDTLRE